MVVILYKSLNLFEGVILCSLMDKCPVHVFEFSSIVVLASFVGYVNYKNELDGIYCKMECGIIKMLLLN